MIAEIERLNRQLSQAGRIIDEQSAQNQVLRTRCEELTAALNHVSDFLEKLVERK